MILLEIDEGWGDHRRYTYSTVFRTIQNIISTKITIVEVIVLDLFVNGQVDEFTYGIEP